ncbi:MAG: 16S rRNA (uracil(1498)-N(3))-methyltransferase [Candidatus Tectimicrobiota bacterium]
MRLFFVAPEQWTGERVTITGPDVHHITRVLRLRPGDLVAVADGAGRLSRVRLERLAAEAVEGTVVETAEAPSEATPSITLAQGLPKGRKFEVILQKAVELGAARIVPVSTARTVVRLDKPRAAARLERWRRVALEAAKQARRTSVPEVAPLTSLEAFLTDLGPPAAGQMRLLLWEEASEPLREALARLRRPTEVVCLVGPEGGFEAAEVARGTEAGFVAASLGPRILRTETAPLALLAILQHTFGGL